uniref:CCHC-type domain-containing protein n=1 Tax=Octopus bimaculoides TaxID=37653 RepID=A0A0L8GX11_OCTBM
MEEDVKVLKVTKTKEVNCWGYSLEVAIQVSLQDLHKIAEEVILPEDVKLRRVVEEGRPPTCYQCGVTGHMRARCPQNDDKGEKERQHQVDEQEQNAEATDPVCEKCPENVEEEYMVLDRKKKRKEDVDSPPKSPLMKKKGE